MKQNLQEPETQSLHSSTIDFPVWSLLLGSLGILIAVGIHIGWVLTLNNYVVPTLLMGMITVLPMQWIAPQKDRAHVAYKICAILLPIIATTAGFLISHRFFVKWDIIPIGFTDADKTRQAFTELFSLMGILISAASVYLGYLVASPIPKNN